MTLPAIPPDPINVGSDLHAVNIPPDPIAPPDPITPLDVSFILHFNVDTGILLGVDIETISVPIP